MKSLCFDGFIDVEYMATSNLVADILTKALLTEHLVNMLRDYSEYDRCPNI